MSSQGPRAGSTLNWGALGVLTPLPFSSANQWAPLCWAVVVTAGSLPMAAFVGDKRMQRLQMKKARGPCDKDICGDNTPCMRGGQCGWGVVWGGGKEFPPIPSSMGLACWPWSVLAALREWPHPE